MAFTAEISRANPTCFLFLIDRSKSMNAPLAGGAGNKKKANVLADSINRLLQALVLRCAKTEGIRNYFHVGVLAYGVHAGPALGGALAGRAMVPISEIADNPLR